MRRERRLLASLKLGRTQCMQHNLVPNHTGEVICTLQQFEVTAGHDQYVDPIGANPPLES